MKTEPEKHRFTYFIARREHSDDRPLDQIIDPRPEITVEFDYPLNNPVRMVFASAAGFTRAQFAEAITEGYERLYREEDETTKTPVEPVNERRFLLNRNATDGKHGIWGHDIGDLVLECAYQDADGIWNLGVGS